MAHEEFVAMRKTPEQRMGRIVEEFGEVLVCVGKIMSFGPQSVNPLIPKDQQETNIDALLRELKDAELAINRFRQVIEAMAVAEDS